MKNFDTARRSRQVRPASERTFVLCDQQFVVRATVPANVMVKLDEITGGGVSPGRILGIVSEVVDDMVEPPGGEVWRALVDRGADDDPLTLGDVMEVLGWLVENETAIPTVEPSPSGDGSANPATGEPSMDGAPSPALTPPNSPVDVFSGQPTPTSPPV